MRKIIKDTIKLLFNPFLSRILKRYSWHTFKLWKVANKIDFPPLATKNSVQFSHAKLTLKASSPLYRASAKDLYINVDETIFPQIITHQEWGTSNNEQILSHLRGESIGLIDVGANVGLFTRQMLIASKKITHAYCFEPEISNFELAAANLKNFTNVSLFNFGLADVNKTIDVSVNLTNSGNISLNKNAILNTICGTEKVEIRRPDISKEPFSSIIRNHNSLVYKSDTEGLDEVIFTHLGTNFWKKIECAMLEISRIPDKKIDYDNMNEIYKNHFSKIYSLNRNSFLEFSEYVTYSNGTDRTFDDILFIK
jgi:FkbM family methyltransferase